MLKIVRVPSRPFSEVPRMVTHDYKQCVCWQCSLLREWLDYWKDLEFIKSIEEERKFNNPAGYGYG